ncbi:helix-turn-helix domain-containing protein [Dactylosporangium sp. NPDC051541]|uniref:helix-turn-helix domain-containing protein n=1 Tax=Dactylosporangium sp. NPDC051541 TaxID=3363977 RepID=UPI00379A86E9
MTALNGRHRPTGTPNTLEPQILPQQRSHRAASPIPAPLLLTVEEAAARLQIGRTLMYDLLRTGAVASVQVGRLRRIRPADLEAYTASLTPDVPDAQAA